MVLACGLMELPVLQRLEVQRACEVERMIRNRTAVFLRWRADEAGSETGNLRKATNFSRKEIPFCWGGVFAKPEACAVDEHGRKVSEREPGQV